MVHMGTHAGSAVIILAPEPAKAGTPNPIESCPITFGVPALAGSWRPMAKTRTAATLGFTKPGVPVEYMPVDLRSGKLFSGMLATQLRELEQTAQFKFYKAGRNIFQEGDPGDGLYLIAEGAVQITCLVGQDQRRVLSRLTKGDFFGEMAVLDEQPRSATATAETDVKLHFIAREVPDFRRLNCGVGWDERVESALARLGRRPHELAAG